MISSPTEGLLTAYCYEWPNYRFVVCPYSVALNVLYLLDSIALETTWKH